MITVIAALRFEVVLNCSVEHIVPAKFRELSQMKLADWAAHGWSSFLAALGAGIFKHAGIILHTSVFHLFISRRAHFPGARPSPAVGRDVSAVPTLEGGAAKRNNFCRN